MIFFTPLNKVFASVRLLVVLLVKFTDTTASLFTKIFTAFTHAFCMWSFIGQAGVVSTTVNETSLPLITTSFIIFNVTRSCPRSGSCTLLRALNISSVVIFLCFFYWHIYLVAAFFVHYNVPQINC